MKQNIKRCQYCLGEIHIDAVKCKHCKEFINSNLRLDNDRSVINIVNITNTKNQLWSPGIAALLSFIIPGVGQIYKGNVISGLLWMFFTFIGYFMLLLPGIILHIICIIAATTGDPYKN